MKLQLDQKEIEKVLLAIFCDGGLTELYHSGVDYRYNKTNYEKFKVGNCFEDNLLSLLTNGGRLGFLDLEADDEEVIYLTLKSATEKLKTIEDTDRIEEVRKILDDNGGYDAWTCYNLLQFILYGEVIFG